MRKVKINNYINLTSLFIRVGEQFLVNDYATKVFLLFT